MFFTMFGTFLATALFFPVSLAFAQTEVPKPTRSEVFAKNGMAATAQPLATQVALDVLKRGGSAVDAAIAANAALGLMEPTGCGIGGDLFAIVWDPKTNRLHGYNGSGRSPKGLTREQLLQELKKRELEQIPPLGPLPVTVPGCVDGWCALHERFGVLPLQQVLAPAISYARDGFPLTPVIADAWGRSVPRLKSYEGFVQQFTVQDASGEPRAPRVGEVWKNENLARTYERIVAEGRAGFYKGEVPQIIERYIKAQGGFLAAADFEAHSGEWVEPISTNYRGYDIWEIPPNTQGISALQILNMMEAFDVRGMGFGSAEYIHTFVEAKKIAFEDRACSIGDQSLTAAPVSRMLSKEWAAKQRAKIDPSRAAKNVTIEQRTGADTTYLTVADSSGMMVSLIQSNYRGMGSGMVPGDWSKGKGGGLGFMLQDRGEQFALVVRHPNVYEPGKRPFHTIIPAFITKDGKPWMSFGVMGGAMQPQGHAQIVMNLIDFGMTLQQAGDAPRIHHDGSTEPQGAVTPMVDGGVLNLEPGFSAAVIERLVKMGHRIQAAETQVFGGFQAIRWDAEKGVFIGATERRKDGCASGW
jgi:gamma-glutamyltranspeptidase/glutathione hydrolase